MRIPDWVPRSVVFLGQRTVKNRREMLRLAGTAFAVAVPAALPGGRTIYHRYLVTARHVVLALAGREICVRANTTDGYYKQLVIGRNAGWWTHPTEERFVDAAVLPFENIDGGLEDLEVTPVEADRILSRDDQISDYYIDQGDEVYISGLFTKLTGEERNLPICRTGAIAMMPRDKIPNVKIGDSRVDMEGYLVEIRSVGGLSGSPVFVRASIGLPCQVVSRSGQSRIVEAHVPGDFFLLGLVHGHWEIAKDKLNMVAFPPPSLYDTTVNLGIAIVVPARKILEIVNQPKLKEMRQRFEEELRRQEGEAVPD
jgi:hypothetical protein